MGLSFPRGERRFRALLGTWYSTYKCQVMTDEKPYANEKLEYSVIRAITSGQLPARQAILDVGDVVSTVLTHCWAPVESRPPVSTLEDMLSGHYEPISSLRKFFRAESSKLDINTAVADYKTQVNDWSAYQNPDYPNHLAISSFRGLEGQYVRYA